MGLGMGQRVTTRLVESISGGGPFNFARITNSLNMEDRHQRTFPLKVEEEINFK